TDVLVGRCARTRGCRGRRGGGARTLREVQHLGRDSQRGHDDPADDADDVVAAATTLADLVHLLAGLVGAQALARLSLVTLLATRCPSRSSPTTGRTAHDGPA